MSQHKEQISILIEYTVAAENTKPDLEACLEIADRVNSGKGDCIEAMATIQKLLVHKSPQVVLNTILLLETLCKNCNMLFLRELNSKKMVESMMKLLIKRRDRAKYGKIAPSTKNDNKVQIEDKALYLIQLWADTFMMHQEEYKNIHEAYRALRKEGVKFPDRDPTMKYMINFQGTISPVFLAMEENYIVPSNNQGGAPLDPRKSNIDRPKVVEPEYKHTTEKQSYNNYQQNTLYDEEGEDEDDEGMDAVEITKDEVKIIEESINILNEIKVNATKPGDMKSEIAREILADLVHVRKRLNKLILTDTFSTNSQRNQAMLLNDSINSNLEGYKNRYSELKNEYKLGIKSEPLVKIEAPKKTEEKTKGGDDAKEQQETDAKKDFNADLKKRFTKLAPPTGWKGTKKQEVVDLLDDNLLGDPKEEQKSDNSQKSDKPKANPQGDLLDNILNLQIGTNNTNQQGGNSKIAVVTQGFPQQQQQQSQQVNNDLSKLFNQPQIQNNIIPNINPFGNFQQPNNNLVQSGYLTSSNLYNNQQQHQQPNSFIQQQIQQPNLFQQSNQTFVQQQVSTNTNSVFTQPIITNDQKKPDDDDFFSDLANKK